MTSPTRPVRRHYITVRAKAYPKDTDIATELDNHFLFFRIGHAGKGSWHSEVTDRSHWLSRLLCALDG